MAKTPLKYWNADFWLRNLHNGRQFQAVLFDLAAAHSTVTSLENAKYYVIIKIKEKVIIGNFSFCKIFITFEADLQRQL